MIERHHAISRVEIFGHHNNYTPHRIDKAVFSEVKTKDFLVCVYGGALQCYDTRKSLFD